VTQRAMRHARFALTRTVATGSCPDFIHCPCVCVYAHETTARGREKGHEKSEIFFRFYLHCARTCIKVWSSSSSRLECITITKYSGIFGITLPQPPRGDYFYRRLRYTHLGLTVHRYYVSPARPKADASDSVASPGILVSYSSGGYEQ